MARRIAALLLVTLVVSVTLGGCGLVGARPPSMTSVPGFFVAIWGGLIAPWTLILRAFMDVRMYAVPNSGWWYDAGLLLGITGSIPVGWAAAIIVVGQYVVSKQKA